MKLWSTGFSQLLETKTELTEWKSDLVVLYCVTLKIWLMDWLTDCFSFLCVRNGCSRSWHSVSLQSSPSYTADWASLTWLAVTSWLMRTSRWVLRFWIPEWWSVSNTQYVLMVSSCGPNRCGFWRWTVIQLSIQTVRCWRRWYPALLWRHWVSSELTSSSSSSSYYTSMTRYSVWAKADIILMQLNQRCPQIILLFARCMVQS